MLARYMLWLYVCVCLSQPYRGLCVCVGRYGEPCVRNGRIDRLPAAHSHLALDGDTYRRHLANAIEQFVHGGDAALLLRPLAASRLHRRASSISRHVTPSSRAGHTSGTGTRCAVIIQWKTSGKFGAAYRTGMCSRTPPPSRPRPRSFGVSSVSRVSVGVSVRIRLLFDYSNRDFFFVDSAELER